MLIKSEIKQYDAKRTHSRQGHMIKVRPRSRVNKPVSYVSKVLRAEEELVFFRTAPWRILISLLVLATTGSSQPRRCRRLSNSAKALWHICAGDEISEKSNPRKAAGDFWNEGNGNQSLSHPTPPACKVSPSELPYFLRYHLTKKSDVARHRRHE